MVQKNLGPSRKTLLPSWCRKLVTGLPTPQAVCKHTPLQIRSGQKKCWTPGNFSCVDKFWSDAVDFYYFSSDPAPCLYAQCSNTASRSRTATSTCWRCLRRTPTNTQSRPSTACGRSIGRSRRNRNALKSTAEMSISFFWVGKLVSSTRSRLCRGEGLSFSKRKTFASLTIKIIIFKRRNVRFNARKRNSRPANSLHYNRLFLIPAEILELLLAASGDFYTFLRAMVWISVVSSGAVAHFSYTFYLQSAFSSSPAHDMNMLV